MHSSCPRPRAGYTMIQILIVMAIVGVLATAAVVAARHVMNRGKTAVLANVVVELNRASDAFVGAKGTFDANASAADYLLVLQTPVDDVSQQAGFGTFPVVSPSWQLESVDEGERLTCFYSAAEKRPIWGMATTGPGYRVVVDDSRTEPAPADWSAYVAQRSKLGQIGDRSGKWLWERGSAAVPLKAGGGGTPRNQIAYAAGTQRAGSLSISGPTSVTTPGGPYYWSGISATPGTLTISINGLDAVTRSFATSIESPKKTFSAGAHGTYVVTLTRAEGGTVSQQVDVDIPAEPEIEIAGPEIVTGFLPTTWTATVTNGVTPSEISMTVDDVRDTAANRPTLAVSHNAWPPSTNRVVTVIATAVNGSGFTRATKSVTIATPTPEIVWNIVPEPSASVTINATNSYTVVATADLKGYTGPFTLDAILTADCVAERQNVYMSSDGVLTYAGGTPYGSLPYTRSVNGNTVTFTIDKTALPGATRVRGNFTVDATLTIDGHATKKSSTFAVAIPPMQGLFGWTYSVGMKAEAVQGIGLYINGQLVAQTPAGQASATFEQQLGPGRYSVYLIGTASVDEIPYDGVGSREHPLTLVVSP